MKKIITLLVILLLLSTTLALSINKATSFAINKSTCEKQISTSLYHLTKIIQRISDRFQSHQRKYCSLDQRTTSDVDDFNFIPEDIGLKDDAFYGADTLHFTEWWYFDAILDRGYSIQIIIQVIGMMKQNIVLTKLNIYKDGDLKAGQEKIYLPDDFYASTDVPLIMLNGKQVMKGYVDNGDWIYDVSLEIDDISADLQFTGCVKGWKGKVPVGEWAVILPKAEVSGTIKINSIETDVTGIGYHDHNWELTARASVLFGWCWGKINANNITAVWSSIMDTRIDSETILVINEGIQNHINIESENIEFIIKDFSIENRKLIPKEFVLIANTPDVSLYITMTVLETHYVRVGPVNYWRYHIKCHGSITIGSQVENVDEIQISEYVRFR